MKQAIVAGLAALIVLSGCSGENAAEQSAGAPPVTPTPVAPASSAPAAPDLTACRAAITTNYVDGWEKVGNDPWPPATRTAACSGVDRPTLTRLMDEAVADIMNGTTGPQ